MIDRAKFFDGIRPLFGSISTTQVSGAEALLAAWEGTGFTDLRWLAYGLATARHETADTMQPIEEYGHGKGHSYGLPAGPWHQVFDGRGDVQLTWERNYVFATQRLRAMGVIGADINLDQTPELAMRQDIAAAIMWHGMSEGWFTGKKFANYFGAGADWVNARRIINGTDQAEKIAGYGESFYAAILKAAAADVAPAPAAGDNGGTSSIGALATEPGGNGAAAVAPPPAPAHSIPLPPIDPRPDPGPAPTPAPAPPTQPASSGLFAALAALLAGLFRSK